MGRVPSAQAWLDGTRARSPPTAQNVMANIGYVDPRGRGSAALEALNPRADAARFDAKERSGSHLVRRKSDRRRTRRRDNEGPNLLDYLGKVRNRPRFK